MVRPGVLPSRQSQMPSSEDGIAVAGPAEVTRGARRQFVTENRSVCMTLGKKPRMADPGRVPMSPTGVHAGACVGEGDTIRVEDIYNRS